MGVLEKESHGVFCGKEEKIYMTCLCASTEAFLLKSFDEKVIHSVEGRQLLTSLPSGY